MSRRVVTAKLVDFRWVIRLPDGSVSRWFFDSFDVYKSPRYSGFTLVGRFARSKGFLKRVRSKFGRVRVLKSV